MKTNYSGKRKLKILRITTVPITLEKILVGQLNYINKFFDLTAVSSYDKKIFESIAKKENVSLKKVSFRRKISPINDLITLFELIFLMLKERPHIVHSQTPKAGFLSMLAAFLTRVPLKIHTVGGLPFINFKGVNFWIMKKIESFTYLLSDKVYSNSHQLMNYIIEKKIINPEKISVIANGSSNGIDTSFYKKEGNINQKLRSTLNLCNDDFVFTFVGRICNDKGIRELIDAFEGVNLNYKKTKLLLVGPFEKSNGYLDSNYSRKIKNNTNIIYAGRTDDVRSFLSISNCFVFPSYREGFPNVLLQAGSMSVPIIASNINGCNELVDHSINGFLISSKDTLDLEKKMLIIFQDNNLASEFSKSMRKKVVNKYDNRLVWKSIVNEYNVLLHK